MKRISRTSFILKRLLPFFIIGILLLMPLIALIEGRFSILVIVIPALIIAFTLFIMRKLVWELADEVYDAGEFLLVRRGGDEQKIYFSDIVNINYQGFTSPSRISVLCRTPGAFGNEVVFSGPLSFNPLNTPKLVQDLVERADRTRRR